MKYICEVVEESRSAELPFSNQESKDSSEQQILAEINDQKIIAQGGEISLINLEGKPEWESPFEIEGKPNEIYISEDRLLLTTSTKDYHAWGFLRPAFLINMIDGSLVAKLKGESGAALSNGRFILGLEGYDYFNTWLYDRNGELILEWRSYGNYIVGENDDIRVLEKDRRNPTKSRLVRLKVDGQIEKGPLLNESQISKPLVLGNKSLIFIDCGTIRIVDLGLKEQYKKVLMTISKRDSWRFHSDLQFRGKKISVDIYERTKESPIEYTKHSWLMELGYEC